MAADHALTTTSPFGGQQVAGAGAAIAVENPCTTEAIAAVAGYPYRENGAR